MSRELKNVDTSYSLDELEGRLGGRNQIWVNLSVLRYRRCSRRPKLHGGGATPEISASSGDNADFRLACGLVLECSLFFILQGIVSIHLPSLSRPIS